MPLPLVLRLHRHVLARLLLGAVCISFSGVWVKLCHVPPATSAFYRVFFAGLLLLPAALIRGEIKWHGFRHLFLGLACGFSFALDLVFFHYSILYVGPGLGTILPNFQVFVLAWAGVLFLGEKLRFLFVISMPIAFMGLFMIVGLDFSQMTASYKTGVACGLATALCYSAYLLSLRKLQAGQKGLSFFYVLTMVSLFSAAILALEILWTGGTFAIPDGQSFLALAALALFSQTFGWLMISNALPHIRASLSGLILLLQPALAFVWDVSLFERPFGPTSLAGVCITLGAIYLGARASRT